MRASRQVRLDVVGYAQALHRRNWVANHDGNITVRLGPGRFLATPTATSKADVCDKNLLEVDGTGERVAGTSRRFSEINLHLAVYTQRPDVHAVVHAHPPHATALACAGRNLIERPFLPEAIVSIGPLIPLVPFSPPGKAAAEALKPYIDSVDAVLLESHGVLTWGQNIEQAYLRMELLEHLATIAIAAESSGGVRPLAHEVLAPLLESRAKAGLGHAADRAVELHGKKTISACAPAPHSRVAVTSPKRSPAPTSSALANAAPEVHRIIREEIVKILSSDS